MLEDVHEDSINAQEIHAFVLRVFTMVHTEVISRAMIQRQFE